MQTKIKTFQNDLNELLSHRALEDLFSLPLLTEPTSFHASFIFPKTTDYRDWILERDKLRDYEAIVGQSAQCLYNQIAVREDVPVAGANARSKVNGIYIIADSTGEILYIGKSGANFKDVCNDLVINRILDHLVPESINKMQNTPQLWRRIEGGENVQVCYWSGLNRLVPSLLELYLLNQYYVARGILPPLNKRRGRKNRTA
jgi:hypothetical protein